jgi:DNA-binding PadR family transcriptional regulator
MYHNRDDFEGFGPEEWQAKWMLKHGMLKHGLFKHPAFQARRGDMTGHILGVLADKPMHGYEVIRELEKKSHGMWRPSPGSVYPTLQMLEEQDLVEAREEGGKKIYSLTDAGRAEVKKNPHKAPWEWAEHKVDIGRMMEMRAQFFQMAHMFREIAMSGDEAKIKQAGEQLQKTKAELEKILGSDGSDDRSKEESD